MRAQRLPVSLTAIAIIAVVLGLGLASSGAVGTPVHAAPQSLSPHTAQTASPRNHSPTATPQSSPTQRTNRHTLVIKQINGSVGYTVTVSGTLDFQQRESGDSIAGRTATGQVGGFPWQETSSDAKDVIHFTGALQNFEYNQGKIRVILDGRQIDPDSLRNTPAHTPTPIQTPTRTQSPTQTARTTPVATPSPSPSPPSTATPTSTQTTTPPVPTTDGDAPADTGRSGFLDQLVPIITGLAALGAVLYLIFGDG